MFTEYEIESMIEYPEVKEATQALKKDFLKTEAPYLEINDEDFFSCLSALLTVLKGKMSILVTNLRVDGPDPAIMKDAPDVLESSSDFCRALSSFVHSLIFLALAFPSFARTIAKLSETPTWSLNSQSLSRFIWDGGEGRGGVGGGGSIDLIRGGFRQLEEFCIQLK